MNDAQHRIAVIFNEWARRYADNPEEFSEVLDARGNPVADYGHRCAEYFTQLNLELFPPAE